MAADAGSFDYAEAVARKREADARLDEARWWRDRTGYPYRPSDSEQRIASLEAEAAALAERTRAGGLGNWRVVASEERGVGGITYTHLTLHCALCGNTSAVIFPARETPKFEPCACIQIAGG